MGGAACSKARGAGEGGMGVQKIHEVQGVQEVQAAQDIHEVQVVQKV